MSAQESITLFCLGLLIGCFATIAIASLAIVFYKSEVKA